jgi:hypothetical protein
MVMARPKNADRQKVKNITLTLKLTLAERKRLHQLVEARAEELHKLTGQRIDVSASAYIRWLMDRDAEERGLDDPTKTAASRPRQKR